MERYNYKLSIAAHKQLLKLPVTVQRRILYEAGYVCYV